MENLIITINRENGSGGRYIGELLAKKLNIKCYNNDFNRTIKTNKRKNRRQ